MMSRRACGRDDKIVEPKVRFAPTRYRGMSKLIYIANVSLDGYIEDSHGNFDWTEPNDEVFAFITDLVRSSGTYLYGRRMYETRALTSSCSTSAGSAVVSFTSATASRPDRPASGRWRHVSTHRAGRRTDAVRALCATRPGGRTTADRAICAS